MKLKEAQFGPRDEGEMEMVVGAFASAFPSLEGIAPHVWGYLQRDVAATDALVAALDASSCNGEWPGSVQIKWTEIAGKENLVFDECQIVPYCGDRICRITGIGVVICDYSRRPSLTAASEVIKLIEANSVHLWNPPVWDDGVDE